MITQVRKRDGRIVKFRKEKITDAILKAMEASDEIDEKLAGVLTEKVSKELDKRGKKFIPNVEQIQDEVERVLIDEGHAKIAKSYILYRQKRAEIREAKALLGIKDDLKLSINAIKVLERRYLRHDAKGKVTETPSDMFRRVARTIAQADLLYGDEEDAKKSEKEFFEIMSNLEFLPNSPCLMNAGLPDGQLAACFVLPVDDSMKSIFETLKQATLIHTTGGGTGFSFSRIRPKGDIVHSSGGMASGPMSFIRVYNAATEATKEGGRRRGANMGILNVDHPDIIEFIISKEKSSEMANFNLSVALTDDFMKKVQADEDYNLINPRTGEIANNLSARRVFDLIVTMAWKCGDPGVVFIDRMNNSNSNPVPSLGRIEATNPCGEQPLLPYESCILGSINLSKMLKEEKEIDWNKLRKVIHAAVHFLDNVIDANKYPLKEIEKLTKASRKIGLGVMGFADLLIKLNIPFNSEDGVKTADKLMHFINEESKKASAELAKERGSFPNFERSIWPDKGYKMLRNATTTTIAPTGTISIIAGCSSGTEPLYAVSYIRTVMDATDLIEVNKQFDSIARERGFYNESLMRIIARKGSIQDLKEIPDDVKNVFVTTHDIPPEWHVLVQAAFQKHTDNGVSKTVNFPHDASLEDIEKTYMLAYKLGCKGITIYRDRSKDEQVLHTQLSAAKKAKAEEFDQKLLELINACKTC